MGALILPSRFPQQPQQAPRIDRGNALGAKVIESIPLSSDRIALVSGAQVTYGASGFSAVTGKGRSLRAQGASGARASVPLDLSKYSVITLAFWLYWDAYANDDAFAMEFTANTNNTAGAFYIDPNSGANGGRFAIVPNGSGANGNGTLYDRPSAATWHRHCVSIDIRTQAVVFAVDGAIVPGISAGAPATAGTTFANSTLNLFSRAGTGLFGTGNLQDLTIYSGALSANEVAQDFANPWQIFKAPSRRIWAVAAGGAQSYSYTASGGIQLSGTALGMRTATKTSVGGVLFSGAATRSKGVAKTPSGGLLLSGASTTLRGRAVAALSGLSLSGAAGVLRGATRASLGGLKMAGAATVAFFSAIQTRIVNPVGGILLGGAASVARAVRKASSSGFILSGAATVTSGAAGRFRALILVAGILRVIPTAQLGTGKKPIVYIAQRLRERLAAEGTPVILVNGRLRQLQPGETLDI